MFKIKKRLELFIPSVEAGDLLESFLVSAVSSLLIIRAYLELTNYPQLGNGKFHIAHMLWGGFFMMAAIFLLLVFLNKESKKIAAVIGGIGFGTFIDELGKFITRDNNYFFEPTIAFIYIIFISLFLIMRAGEKYVHLSHAAYAVNALELLKEVFLLDLDSQEKKRAQALLKLSDQNNPAIIHLQNALGEIRAKKIPNPNKLAVIKNVVSQLYLNTIRSKKFAQVIVFFFVFYTTINLVKAIFSFSLAYSVAQWGQVISSIVSSFLVVIGIINITTNRFTAYKFFQRAVLVTIFFTQFFLYFREQLSATLSLIFSVTIYYTLQFLIEEEKTLIGHNSQDASVSASQVSV